MGVHIRLLFVMIFWGSAFVSGRMLALQYHPIAIAFSRFLLASCLLVPTLYLKEGRILPLEKKSYFKFLLLGMFGIFAYNVCFLFGLKMVEAGRSSVVIALNPVVTAIFSAIFFKESIHFKKAIGIILGIFGALVVLTKGKFSGLLSIGQGELFLMGAVVSWVTYTLVGKKFIQKLSILEVTTWSCLFGSLILLPLSIFNGLDFLWSHLSIIDFFNIANLGVFSTYLGFIWYYEGVKILGATNATSYINFLPVIGVICGIIFLNEAPGPSLYVGACITILGVFLVNRKIKS